MVRALLSASLCGMASSLVVSRAVLRPPSALKVSYLSEVEDEDKKKKFWDEEMYGKTDSLPSDPRDHSGVGEVDTNYGPKDYDGFIDVEGFDGGDGQVGVVGDGKNAMEEYDMGQAVEKRGRANQLGGKESKLNAKNAWGTSSGYAEELKRKGMVEYNEYGEDMLQARRQQLENWRNQQELRLQKDGQMAELANLQGKKYQAINHGSYIAQFEKNREREGDVIVTDGHDSYAVEGDMVPGDVMDVLPVKARLNARGGTTIVIRNEFSTYDDFVAGFAPGASAAISVEPSSGTLNRRSGDPQEFVVKFQPTDFADSYDATLVIETENHKWTYEIVGSPP